MTDTKARLIKSLQPPRIGFDLGDTIIQVERDPANHFRGNEPWLAPTFPEAIQWINLIVNNIFGSDNAFIVSKVGTNARVKTPLWFEKNNFFSTTGMKDDSVHYCAERHEKAPIIEKLGITYFVDNRPDVLWYLRDLVPHRILFQPDWSDYTAEELEKIKDENQNVVVVSSWKEVHDYIISTFEKIMHPSLDEVHQ